MVVFTSRTGIVLDRTRLPGAASKVKKRASSAAMVLYHFSPDSNVSRKGTGAR